MRITSLFILASITLSFFIPNFAFAQSVENSLYKVEIENINSFEDPSITKDINRYQENAGNEIKGVNYKIDFGQNYSPSGISFSFSISSLKIDFGILSPTNPVTRNNILKIKNSKPIGYKVTAAQNHELAEAKKGIKIPDTTCDNGKCTEYLSSQWENTLTYGFGYRCDSSKSTCVENDNSFKDKTFFKQFSDTSKDEPGINILSEGYSFGQEASITYKTNISSSQPKGSYSNTVTFLAIPNY